MYTHRSMLQHTATRHNTQCNTKQHTTTHRNAPQHTCSIFYHSPERLVYRPAIRCNILQHNTTHTATQTASHRIMPHHTTTNRNTPQHLFNHSPPLAQHTASHLNTPHHTASHCNTPQHLFNCFCRSHQRLIPAIQRSCCRFVSRVPCLPLRARQALFGNDERSQAYMRMYICVCVHIYASVNTCTYIYIYIHTCIYIYIYI